MNTDPAITGYLAGYMHKVAEEAPDLYLQAHPSVPVQKGLSNVDLRHMVKILRDPKFMRFHKDKKVLSNTFKNMNTAFKERAKELKKTVAPARNLVKK